MKFSAALITSFMAAGALAQTPLVFYAKVNDSMVPLFGNFVEPPAVVGSKFSVLSYNEASEPPVEFIVEDDYAVTYNGLTPGYVGFFHNLLSYGGLITKTKLGLDEHMRVTNADFYSCDGFPYGEMRWIGRNPGSNKDKCFKVDIYLLPSLSE